MKAFKIHMLAASIAVGSTTLVSGCAPVPMILSPEDSGSRGSGIVRQSFVQPHRIEITLEGQLYTGEWRSQAAPDHPLAHSYIHKHKVGRVVTTLTGSNGKHLDCNWLIDGMHGYGTCETENHRKFDVTIG